MSKYEIIDNCLPENEFNTLVNMIIPDSARDSNIGTIPWNMSIALTTEQPEDNDDFYFINMAYCNDVPTSELYDILSPCLNILVPILKLRSLMRIKANWYPPTTSAYDHTPHTDYGPDFGEVKGAILSLNTCDGWTRLEDGTKADSVANRLLLFNSTEIHNSSSTTNPKGRFNINFNYL